MFFFKRCALCCAARRGARAHVERERRGRRGTWAPRLVPCKALHEWGGLFARAAAFTVARARGPRGLRQGHAVGLRQTAAGPPHGRAPDRPGRGRLAAIRRRGQGRGREVTPKGRGVAPPQRREGRAEVVELAPASAPCVEERERRARDGQVRAPPEAWDRDAARRGRAAHRQRQAICSRGHRRGLRRQGSARGVGAGAVHERREDETGQAGLRRARGAHGHGEGDERGQRARHRDRGGGGAAAPRGQPRVPRAARTY